MTLGVISYALRSTCRDVSRQSDFRNRQPVASASQNTSLWLKEMVPMPQSITLNINGKDQTIAVEPDSMLLYALRDNLGLHGPKFGCGLAECGACTVVMNGNAVRSCVTPISAVGQAKVITLEGLGTVDNPHPLQKAFIEEQAAQCGYCINGMIMAAKALLDQNRHPNRDDIKQALDGNLCRCGTHMRILRAIERVAAQGA
jgi:nicotinate dehydrogenase subunit A